MKKLILAAIIFIPIIFFATQLNSNSEKNETDFKSGDLIDLPAPDFSGQFSLEELLAKRSSVRSFRDESLSLTAFSQLLWAAQGINRKNGFRTVPSAGALFPLEVYLLAKNIDGLNEGIYKYLPAEHKLETISLKKQLEDFPIMQEWSKTGAGVLIITGVYGRTTQKYGERGIRYVHIEAGCAAQSIYLQAESLGLGTTLVGAFDDNEIKNFLNLDENESPLAILPIGKPL